ncbi:MAG: substrate-binding domain-containing protein [Candidatus Njordarchaeia archaeon]
MREIEEHILTRLNLTLEYRGKTIIDKTMANILRIIKEKGSILAAAKMLNIPYSRIWERISKVEKIVGSDLVKRGRARKSGVALTKLGSKLLDLYIQKCLEKNVPIEWHVDFRKHIKIGELIFIGSHDPLMEKLLNVYSKERNVDLTICWTGSLVALESLKRGEAQIVASHLYDFERNEYNIPFLESMKLENVVIYRGLQREIGFAASSKLEVESVEELFSGAYRIANRNKGSGTRRYVEDLAKKLGANEIPGFESEFATHLDVAKAIALDLADFGLTIRYAAELYDLKFISLKWEKYDIITTEENVKQAEKFIKFIESKIGLDAIKQFKGYRLQNNKFEMMKI